MASPARYCSYSVPHFRRSIYEFSFEFVFQDIDAWDRWPMRHDTGDRGTSACSHLRFSCCFCRYICHIKPVSSGSRVTRRRATVPAVSVTRGNFPTPDFVRIFSPTIISTESWKFTDAELAHTNTALFGSIPLLTGEVISGRTLLHRLLPEPCLAIVPGQSKHSKQQILARSSAICARGDRRNSVRHATICDHGISWMGGIRWLIREGEEEGNDMIRSTTQKICLTNLIPIRLTRMEQTNTMSVYLKRYLLCCKVSSQARNSGLKLLPNRLVDETTYPIWELQHDFASYENICMKMVEHSSLSKSFPYRFLLAEVFTHIENLRNVTGWDIGWF